MKILWLSHFIPYPPKGGVLQRGYHLVKQIAERHEVHLLAFNQQDLLRPLFESLEAGQDEAMKHLSSYCQSVEFVDLPCDKSKWHKYWIAIKSLFTPQPYTMNWLKSDDFANSLQKLLSEHSFDYIHFDTISLAIFKNLCGNIPTSLDHHNIESHMLLRRAQKANNLFKKAYYYQEGIRLEKYERKYCPQFTFNFTCSNVDTERLKSISKKSNVYTIPNGVDIEFFKPNPSVSKEKRLIFIGRLNWYPNTEAVRFIAKAVWPIVRERNRELVFDIVGANPPKDIVDIAKEDSRLNVHGFVDDISYYFDSALCYVCPIKDGGGTKLKVLDALACGKAIIADKIACEGIDVTNNENVIFATTAEEYADCIDNIISDESLRMKLENNARALAVNSYAFSSIGQSLSDLYYSNLSKEKN